MPKGQGYSYGGSQIGGTTKSSAKSASLNYKSGNVGKPIGDKGKKSSKGNRMTKVPGDRYNY